jgi:hypothetical protein
MHERNPLQAPLNLRNLLPYSNKAGERYKAICHHRSNHLPLPQHLQRLPVLLVQQGQLTQVMILPYDRLDGGLVFCFGFAACQFSRQAVDIGEAMFLFTTFGALLLSSESGYHCCIRSTT